MDDIGTIRCAIRSWRPSWSRHSSVDYAAPSLTYDRSSWKCLTRAFADVSTIACSTSSVLRTGSRWSDTSGSSSASRWGIVFIPCHGIDDSRHTLTQFGRVIIKLIISIVDAVSCRNLYNIKGIFSPLLLIYTEWCISLSRQGHCNCLSAVLQLLVSKATYRRNWKKNPTFNM